VPKPFVILQGTPLLAHVLERLQHSPAIRWIVLVVGAGERARARALVKRLAISKALDPCLGGASRAESVARGFAALPAQAKWILVHDGVRPCLSPQLLERAIRAGRQHGAVACGVPASLTVKATDASGAVRVTLDREGLWFVQTPQVFRRDWFAEAFARVDHQGAHFPDDAAVVESAGFPVRMIPGDPLNLKVTTREDLLLAEAIVARRNGRS